MTTIKINAITAPSGGEEMVRRFAARAGVVQNRDGFEGFELLAPTDGRDVYLVVSRWRDEDSFQAWLSSEEFARAHRAFRPGEEGGAPAADGEGAGPRKPIGISAQLWSYEVATLGTPD
ncbi:MAG: antibiotic biosynthesis monooxygenase [Austwickia sp.]|nr:antibiotic biosynthesis monooxygenase [Actinomycetota bacterium]MCO5308651.1 antibiotic biosynthesis monooxygenase [Austwickia sp.]